MRFISSVVSLVLVGATQTSFGMDQAQLQGVISSLDSNNYFEVQNIIDRSCTVDPGRTIDSRAAASRERLQCLKQARSTLQATQADFVSIERANGIIDPLISEAEDDSARSQSQVDFMGLKWGLGFGYSDSNDSSIDQASIVDGIVRVQSEKKQRPRAIMEFHKYFWCNDNRKIGTKGCGPFVAVAATSDDLLSGVGMGLMYGRKTSAQDSDGFSVGLGVLLDDSVKDLADGFSRNEAAPEGETAVRFETKARWSTLLFVTRTF